MEQSGSQIFTFTWRIENFSMCAQQCGEFIRSSSFVVDFLGNTEWKLRMYPRGEIEPDYISVFLERAEGSDYAQSITINFGFTAFSTIDGKDIKKELPCVTFESGSSYGLRKFFTREKTFECESGLLQNGSLTLRCWLGACVEQKKSMPQPLNADIWNSRHPSEWYECWAQTRVKVSPTSFVWPIKRIDELPCDVKLWTSVPSAMKNRHSFNLSFELKEDSEGAKEIQIEMRKKDEFEKGIFTRCHIKTVGAPKNVLHQETGEWYFDGKETNNIWVFPKFLTIKRLTENYLRHTNNTLYLRFDLSFSSNDDVLHYENISERFSLFVEESEIPCASTGNFEKLYKDEEFADATLRVGDKDFKVHKLVLIAVSDVFHRMFVSSMKEQNSGIVEIDDLDPDTVEWLIKYMYTHKLDELKLEDARKLYSAADKYNIENLKYQLRSLLTSNLSVNTLCETLILSDNLHDFDLLTSVIDYIYMNSFDIFRSKKWKDFTDNHSLLAARTMLLIWTKK